ncbi:MAG: thioredoxin family protein [Bacilli bacterium]|nr:thioredoxin family protein [Bacilli bacterium]
MKQKKTIIYIAIAAIILALSIIVYTQNKDIKTADKNVSKYLKEINYTELKNLLTQKETFVLYIGNESCPNCNNYLPRLIDVIKEYKIEVKYLNTNKLSLKEKPEFEKDIYITGVPTTIFINDGEEISTINRIDGAQSKDFIITKLKDNKYID